MPNARSNILLVQCDSMDGRLMGCMGHPAAVTPHMDRMAERGVLFRNAYCNSPLCVPSRASMFSGLYTHHCEAWNNINGLEETTPTFLNRFTAGGYATLVHGGTDYLSGQHTLRAQLSAHTRSANLHLPVWPKLKPPRVEKTNPRRRTPIDMASLDWPMLDRFCEALTASATSSQPFFAYCGIGTPHPPFSTLQYWHDLIDPEKIDMPGQTQWRHPTADYKRAVFRLNDALPPETIRAYRRVYLAMIAETDAMLGQVLETLEKTKAADSTCVIFISDHGEMAFEHGQHAKMTLYDPAVRVPMIVTGPNVRPGVRDRLVSLVDIYPTLMDLAELPHPEGLDGRSLLPQISGEDVQTPNDVLCQYHGDSMNTGAFLLRRDDWKYIAYMGYPPQLFNLRDDPGELVDLAAIRPEIARAMDKRLREIVDCEAADARAKANDKTAFRAWRATQSDADYHKAMGGIYAGWDAEAARVIDQWLAVP